MKDIQLIDTDTLLNELGSRFDCWIFAGQQRGIETPMNVRTRRKYIHGGYGHAICLGLCSQLSDMINVDFENMSVDPNREKGDYDG